MTGRSVVEVTAVVVTYRRPDQLPKTIRSLLSQSLAPQAIVVCDDASRDETRAVVERLIAERSHEGDPGEGPTLEYVEQASNVGVAENTNTGVAKATTALVANAHDADEYHEDYLLELAGTVAADPTAAFAFCAYDDHSVGTRPQVMRFAEGDIRLPPGSLLDAWLRRPLLGFPVWGTTVFRRDAVMAAGGFDRQYGPLADVDMWLKLNDEYAVHYVDEMLCRLPPRHAVPRNFTLSGQKETLLIARIGLAAIRRAPRRRVRRLVRLVRGLACRVFYGAGMWGLHRVPPLRPRSSDDLR